MQPNLTPQLTGKHCDTSPSKMTQACMSSWKDFTILKTVGGEPILSRTQGIRVKPDKRMRSKS